ncbi:hypothetical protein DT070_05670 [Polaromonas sp. SP1]|nr:hypothetical protein DT070_05670 [Polaromonas sp. SP1]
MRGAGAGAAGADATAAATGAGAATAAGAAAGAASGALAGASAAGAAGACARVCWPASPAQINRTDAKKRFINNILFAFRATPNNPTIGNNRHKSCQRGLKGIGGK